MSKSLGDALNQRAWSVSAVMFDLNAMLDDEGRPISERRADMSVRANVEMEMQLCPFSGTRENKWMNVSALAQINRYYKDILAEMAAFRREAGEPASWDDMLACIVDLLAGPALYLLQHHMLEGPVPARVAVGHKLAAGFFGVLRGLHERLALGADIPVTIDAFLELVESTNALVGGTEVCAGSPPMIRKAAMALLEGSDDQQLVIDPVRLDTARQLALQVRLGIFWHLYDRVQTWSLLKGEFRQHLKPCNDFLRKKLDQAEHELNGQAPPNPDVLILPGTLDPQTRQLLAAALNHCAEDVLLQQDIQLHSDLLEQADCAIQYTGPVEPFARSVANYLHTYRLIEAELSKLEYQLRRNLAYPLDTTIHLGAAVLPTPKALPWYELILGHRLGADGRLTGKSTRVRLAQARQAK